MAKFNKNPLDTIDISEFLGTKKETVDELPSDTGLPYNMLRELRFKSSPGYPKEMVLTNAALTTASFAALYFLRSAYPAFEALYNEKAPVIDKFLVKLSAEGGLHLTLPRMTSTEASRFPQVFGPLSMTLFIQNGQCIYKDGSEEEWKEYGQRVARACAACFPELRTYSLKQLQAFSSELVNSRNSQPNLLLYAKAYAAVLGSLYEVPELEFCKKIHDEEYIVNVMHLLFEIYYGGQCREMVYYSGLDSSFRPSQKSNSEKFRAYKKMHSLRELFDKMNLTNPLLTACQFILYENGIPYDTYISKADLDLVFSTLESAEKCVDYCKVEESEVPYLVLVSMLSSELSKVRHQLAQLDEIKDRVEHDAYVIRKDSSAEKANKEQNTKISELTSQLLAKQDAIGRRDAKIAAQEEEIMLLKKRLQQLEEEFGKEEEAEENAAIELSEAAAPSADDTKVHEELRRVAQKKKILIIGGNQNLMTKFADPNRQPDIKYYLDAEKTSFSQGSLKDYDLILFKTDCLGHAMYNKVKDACTAFGLTFDYLERVTSIPLLEKDILTKVKKHGIA